MVRSAALLTAAEPGAEDHDRHHQHEQGVQPLPGHVDHDAAHDHRDRGAQQHRDAVAVALLRLGRHLDLHRLQIGAEPRRPVVGEPAVDGGQVRVGRLGPHQLQHRGGDPHHPAERPGTRTGDRTAVEHQLGRRPGWLERRLAQAPGHGDRRRVRRHPRRQQPHLTARPRPDRGGAGPEPVHGARIRAADDPQLGHAARLGQRGGGRGALDGGDHRPVPQRAGDRLIRGDLLPAGPEHRPAGGQPGARRRGPRVHDDRSQVLFRRERLLQRLGDLPRRGTVVTADDHVRRPLRGKSGQRDPHPAPPVLTRGNPETPAPRAPLRRAGKLLTFRRKCRYVIQFHLHLPAYPALRPAPLPRPLPSHPIPPSQAARSRKPDSGHADTISITLRARRNAMNPRIQCVPSAPERDETPDPVRSDAVNVRFYCVRQPTDPHDRLKRPCAGADCGNQTADGRNIPNGPGCPPQLTVRALRRWRSPGCDGASVP